MNITIIGTSDSIWNNVAGIKWHLKENVSPVFKPKSNVPFAVVEPINKKKIDRLETVGVILLTFYSEWEAPKVYVKKKKMIIFVDANIFYGMKWGFTTSHISVPNPPEEIFTKLNSRRFSSELDLSDAYLQIKVEEKCKKKLLTINTHQSLCSFNRLPFEVKVLRSIF